MALVTMRMRLILLEWDLFFFSTEQHRTKNLSIDKVHNKNTISIYVRFVFKNEIKKMSCDLLTLIFVSLMTAIKSLHHKRSHHLYRSLYDKSTKVFRVTLKSGSFLCIFFSTSNIFKIFVIFRNNKKIICQKKNFCHLVTF